MPNNQLQSTHCTGWYSHTYVWETVISVDKDWDTIQEIWSLLFLHIDNMIYQGTYLYHMKAYSRIITIKSSIVCFHVTWYKDVSWCTVLSICRNRWDHISWMICSEIRAPRNQNVWKHHKIWLLSTAQLTWWLVPRGLSSMSSQASYFKTIQSIDQSFSMFPLQGSVAATSQRIIRWTEFTFFSQSKI